MSDFEFGAAVESEDRTHIQSFTYSFERAESEQRIILHLVPYFETASAHMHLTSFNRGAPRREDVIKKGGESGGRRVYIHADLISHIWRTS